MGRRQFLVAIGAGVLTARRPLAAHESLGTRRIALVVPAPQSECNRGPLADAFYRRPRELGSVSGPDLSVNVHCYTSIREVREIITEVVRLKPEVILAGDTQSALAAKMVASTIPIVFAPSSDPVQAGLVASFAHPRENVTGIGNLGRELAEKRRLELLKEAR